jgi:hypothetical protein
LPSGYTKGMKIWRSLTLRRPVYAKTKPPVLDMHSARVLSGKEYVLLRKLSEMP